MASLTEHVMINKLGDDLDSAITFVGGDTRGVSNIMQYPEVIRTQLVGRGEDGEVKEYITEDDTCIVIADEEGRVEYNTRYHSGEKTGLNPGAYYIQISTAIEGISPVYIDLTPIMDKIQEGGGDVDVDKIVDRVIEEIMSSDEFQTEIQNEITNQVSSQLNTINSRIEALENKEVYSKTEVNELIEETFLAMKDDEGLSEDDVNELNW